MIKGYHGLIMKKYEELREREREALAKRRAEVAQNAPEILQVERKIASLSMELAMMNFKQNINHQEAFAQLKNEVLNLRGKRMELLTAHGYALDYLDQHYTCTKCEDTGYIRQEKCTCYKKHLIEAYHSTSDFNALIKEYTFAHFKMDFYEDQPGPYPISPRENMQKILEGVLGYIKSFKETTTNLLFYGSPGTGKTFLSSCIAKELLDAGHLVVYRTADGLIQNLKEVKFQENKELLDLLLHCDLLIIDDLGTELTTDFSKVELFNFLNAKLLRKKKMLISTNLTIENLKDKYDERIYSRLVGDFNLYKFLGEDLRIKKNHERTRKA